MSFDDLGLSPEILRAVHDEGYTIPTPVQEQSIPIVLAGHDLMGRAQTGTGKTAAFALPILERLQAHANSSFSPARHPVRCLVVTPTRELAVQVERSFQAYGRHLPLRTTVVYGGVPMGPQEKALLGGIEILVATPGRLLDHANSRTVNLSQVEVLVLDEADRMLDMGFIEDIRKIIALLPAKRQNLLFSATFDPEVRALARTLLLTTSGSCWRTWCAAATSARCWSSRAPSTWPRVSQRGSTGWVSTRPPSMATGAKVTARRHWSSSSRVRSGCSWQRTSRPAGWTSRACPRWSTSSCRITHRTTSTASAERAAPSRWVTPSAS